MSFLLLTEEGPLLLDAGTGVSRLVEPEIQKLIRPYDALRIFLTHYHLDHVVGLSYLAALWPRGSIRVFAPAPPLVDAEPASALDRLLSPPLFGLHYSSFPVPLEVVPVSDGEVKTDGIPICLWRQMHPGGSVGIRVGEAIAYATDTAPNLASVNFLRGVRLLLHELWLTTNAPENKDSAAHSHFGAVADLVVKAQVGSIMLVHHPPWREQAEIPVLAERMTKATGVPTLVAEEGRVYELA